MNGSKFQFSPEQDYNHLEALIGRTSEALEHLVKNQGPSFEVSYKKWTMYLTQIRVRDNYGTCYGVRWAKYRLGNEGRKIWYNGWQLGRVPASTIKKLDPEEETRLRELEKWGKKIMELRKILTSKKKRILGTFQSIRQTDTPRLQDALQNIEGLPESEICGVVEYF